MRFYVIKHLVAEMNSPFHIHNIKNIFFTIYNLLLFFTLFTSLHLTYLGNLPFLLRVFPLPHLKFTVSSTWILYLHLNPFRCHSVPCCMRVPFVKFINFLNINFPFMLSHLLSKTFFSIICLLTRPQCVISFLFF